MTMNPAIFLVVAFAALATGQSHYGGVQSYHAGHKSYGVQKGYGGGGYGAVKVEKYHSYGAYHGVYPGKCGADGFYYNDANTFIICSNGNAYVQACAPGSRNSGYSRYQYGKDYTYNDFCDVNLVDYGYGAHFGYGGGRSHGYGYGGYGYPDGYYAGGYGQGGYGYGAYPGRVGYGVH